MKSQNLPPQPTNGRTSFRSDSNQNASVRTSNFKFSKKRKLDDINEGCEESNISKSLKKSRTFVNKLTLDRVFENKNPKIITYKLEEKQNRGTNYIKDLIEAESIKIACFCKVSKVEVCEICEGRSVLGYQDFNLILKVTLPKFKGSLPWTRNSFAHILLKLATYGHQLQNDAKAFLSARNVVHHLQKRHEREFDQGKRSFF